MGNKERTAKQKADAMITRRRLLTAITPLGWVRAARSGLPIRYWHRSTQVSALKDATLIFGISALILGREKPIDERLKERIQSFSWKEAENPEKLRAFVEDMAEGYLNLTQSSRVKKENLVNKTRFYANRESYVRGIREVSPNYSPPPSEWAISSYSNQRVFVDLARLRENARSQGHEAGKALVSGLWHEWTHLDVTVKREGELLNNPQYTMESPVSGGSEPYRFYLGGQIGTDTRAGFSRFDEVWTETINLLRQFKLGLEKVPFAGDYNENGMDFFVPFTIKFIPFELMYKMHATSDFEGFAKLVGQNLPGAARDIDKGRNLFWAIDQNSRDLIRQTGVFTKL